MKIIRLAAMLFVVLASASASAMQQQMGVLQLTEDVKKSIVESLDAGKIPPIPKELQTQWGNAQIPMQQQQYYWGLALGLGKMYLDWRYNPIPALQAKIKELEDRIRALEDVAKQK